MELSPAQKRLSYLNRVYLGQAAADVSWLTDGVAIEGDFAGIQAYVQRPVPGAKGAAKRLRARSIRVAETTKKIALDVCREFGAAAPFYVAGGRFLVCAPAAADAAARIAAMQKRVDAEVFARFGAEVAFHVTGAAYRGVRIPRRELFEAHLERKSRPLAHALQDADGWREEAFFAAAGEGWKRCPACLRTVPRVLRVEEGQDI